MKLTDQSSDEGGLSDNSTSSIFTKVIGKLAFFASIVSAALVILTLVITGFSVFRRYVLGTPVTWSDELSGF